MSDVVRALFEAAASPSSYNVLLTMEWAILIPRRAERGGVSGLSVNSMGFAGTMLVRTEEEFEALFFSREEKEKEKEKRKDKEKDKQEKEEELEEEEEEEEGECMAVLRDTGIPW